MTIHQTAWTYRSLARVTPRQAGWVFCILAVLTVTLILISIITNNTLISLIAVWLLGLLFLAGFFAGVSWLIEKYTKDEESKIRRRYALHFGTFFYLFMMGLTILQNLH
jgi:hypothetical protein